MGFRIRQSQSQDIAIAKLHQHGTKRCNKYNLTEGIKKGNFLKFICYVDEYSARIRQIHVYYYITEMTDETFMDSLYEHLSHITGTEVAEEIKDEAYDTDAVLEDVPGSIGADLSQSNIAAFTKDASIAGSIAEYVYLTKCMLLFV